MPNKYKIFVSHAKKDKPLIDNIVDNLLICGLGLKNDDIFCTSIEGLGIEVGDDWRNKIRETLVSSDVVILIITPNFQASEVCMYEMGAAWVSNATVIPAVLAPVTFKTMSTVFNVKQGICLDEKNALDSLCQKLKISLNIDINIGRLGAKKMETDMAIKEYLNKGDFESPITRENISSLETKVEEQSKTIEYYLSEDRRNKEYILSLESLKNKDDLLQAQSDCGMLNTIEIFKEKANNVQAALEKVNRAVQTIIFSDYSKTDLPNFTSFNNPTYCGEFIMAQQSGYITQAGQIDYDKKVIIKISNLLNDFTKYLSKLKETEYNEINNYFDDVDIDMNSSDFWKAAFQISIHTI